VSRQFRVLHVIGGLDTGGAERSLQRLIAGTGRDARYTHSVVSLSSIGTVGAEMESNGVSVRPLGIRSILGVPRAFLRLFRLIRAEAPDIVQTWMYHADLFGGVASRLAGNPRVIWGVRSTDMISGTSRLTAWLRRLCAILSSSVPRFIVCAAEASRRTHEDIGYDASRMVVVPNGFDVPERERHAAVSRRLRKDCGWPDDARVVGCVGRFNHYKDHHNFVNASKRVADQVPLARFLMVGRDIDRANPELVSWIEQTGHADRFTLLGERSDVEACLQAMDVFCLSSRSEGFPNVVGEAMALAVPCCVTDVGDAAFLVGDTGVIVPREDSEALARGLVQLLEMPVAELESLGQRARERIRAQFSAQRTRERFEAMYSSLTATKVPIR